MNMKQTTHKNNALTRMAGVAVLALAIIMTINNKHKLPEGYIGRQEISIADGKMTPETLLALGRLGDPQLSPDGSRILYGVTYTSVEQNRTCRNLFVINTDGSGNVQLTFDAKSLNNARWLDGGSRIAYLKEGQIFVRDIKVRKNGGYALSEEKKVSRVEGGISEFKLSPDGSRVMYVSRVKSHVRAASDLYSDLDKADAVITDDLMYRHWDHWVKDIPHTFVAEFGGEDITPENSTDILGGEGRFYELPIEPFSGMEQLAWSPDGKFIAYSCKKSYGKEYTYSTDTEIYIYNIEKGNTSVIEMKGGYDTEPVWSPDGRQICWLSMERNGYEADKQRLMLADISISPEGEATASEIRELSAAFKYNVISPLWSEDGSEIYFAALAEGIRGIFKVSTVEAAVTRLTSEDLWYDFGSPFASICRDGRTVLLTTVCSMNFPTELAAVTLENGKPVQTFTQITQENEHILSQLTEPKTEARWLKTVDGKEMLTWVLYPSDFDENKVYPSILICLGGPQGTLSQGWSYRWNYRMMAEQGYIVVLPNRRGTTAFGQEWTEQISGDYCGLNMQDYLVAARELKKEKYVGKMAACGASYGGYSVYYLCGTHDKTFDAFIAHCGIFNQEHMYMTTEEMWFPTWDNGGSPWDKSLAAVRHYANSAHKLVQKWDTPLLVIHGAMDFRVPVDQGMAAYNAAQMMGVPSKLLIFPEENHWVLKPQNGLLWHREYFDWLNKWL